MEYNIEDISTSSNVFKKKQFHKQLDIIKKASEEAQNRIDYQSAHNDHVIRAIEVVEEFLRKKHRICYGGQAINAHLPAKYKFYDPEYSIPDYDFFTPSHATDINMIINDLKKAGFMEISAREGMHEGTIKIYVDYVPVADVTEIDPKLYRILSSREFRIDGISYLDANTLRMLMYLELSRPRGEIKRWEKVYERLLLFNEFVDRKACQKTRKMPFKGGLTKEQSKHILDFIIAEKKVFAGADLAGFYHNAIKDKEQHSSWILSSKKPIVFFSEDPNVDASYILSELNMHTKKKKFVMKKYISKEADIIPSVTMITEAKRLLVIIVHQSACHSYYNIPMYDNKIMRIASMDTLITLYFGLGLFHTPFFDMGSMECLADELIQLSTKARIESNRFIFPFISIKCSGHQTTMPSLIRAKVARITAKKKEVKPLSLQNKKQPNTKSNTKSKKQRSVKWYNV